MGGGKKKKKKKKGRKEGEPSSPLPPPASPPPLTLLRVSSCAHACAASFVLGAEPQGLKKMGQSAPRTLLLLLAGLLGEALAGFPNTISIGKRPPRHRDPLLPPLNPRQPRGSCTEGERGAAGGDPGRSRLGARAAPAAGPGSLAVVVREKRGRNGARAALAGGGERWRAAGAAALSVPLRNGGRIWSVAMRNGGPGAAHPTVANNARESRREGVPACPDPGAERAVRLRGRE